VLRENNIKKNTSHIDDEVFCRRSEQLQTRENYLLSRNQLQKGHY